MDGFGVIAGAGGVATFAGIIVTIAKRTGLPAKLEPLASAVAGIVTAEVYLYIGWLGVPASAFTLNPLQSAVGAAVIGVLAGVAADRITAAVDPAQQKPAVP